MNFFIKHNGMLVKNRGLFKNDPTELLLLLGGSSIIGLQVEGHHGNIPNHFQCYSQFLSRTDYIKILVINVCVCMCLCFIYACL